MKDATPVVVCREDYKPPAYTIERLDLVVDLDEHATSVTATSTVVRTAHGSADMPLVLDGKEMKLVSVTLDGRKLQESEFALSAESLTLPDVPARFQLEIVGQLAPAENRNLEGLYLSGGSFCTQCEAEGFRRITWFLDRPDVMTRYRTRIIADKKRYPVLLCNGNLIKEADCPGGRHEAVWDDPFPKPCYLFALVAGDLVARRDSFTTCSGKQVELRVYTDAAQLEQTEHCMESIKLAMRWDEQAFGREYDLDIYMIVAVRDFNMGAMENKGLNLFNSRYVLARPDTATDTDFTNIAAVVAHEYFHNWSGNRVTCRDWFQLSLKEGFTVFRDQEFTADNTSRALKRIQDVQRLMAFQFPEDAGPTAHPVRPDSYVEINNFYTPTVYEKGAELVRMMKTLLGPEKFRQGTDLYFERHDGQAVTCDDFVRALEDASGVDLGQFRLWYSQAGTPIVTARGAYDSARQEYALTLSQRVPPTPSQPEKLPMHIPIEVGLLGPDGNDLVLHLEGEPSARGTSRVIELKEREQTVRFTGISKRPVPSLLRNFSAPVRLEDDSTDDDLLFRMAHDRDPFCKWNAAQTLTHRRILAAIQNLEAGRAPSLDGAFIEAFGRSLRSDADPQLLAQALTLPGENVVADRMESVHPAHVHEAVSFVERSLGQAHRDVFLTRYRNLTDSGPYTLDSAAMGRRSLRNVCLRYLFAASDKREGGVALEQFNSASNMTDMIAALGCLVNVESADRTTALNRFYDRFAKEALVIDKWFAIQASSERPGVLDELRALTRHPVFSLANPNRARALIEGLGFHNPNRFHDPSGAGYSFVREFVLQIDAFNPPVAARAAGPLMRFQRIEPQRRALMVAELTEILRTPNLSNDLYEQASKALESAQGPG